jgi:hypothetical protein
LDRVGSREKQQKAEPQILRAPVAGRQKSEISREPIIPTLHYTILLACICPRNDTSHFEKKAKGF